MLFVIRHGEREDHYNWQKTSKYDCDPRLTKHGKLQAFEVGKSLRHKEGVHIEKYPILVITSPYRRCIQTTKRILKGLEAKSSQLYGGCIHVEDVISEARLKSIPADHFKELHFFQRDKSNPDEAFKYNSIAKFNHVRHKEGDYEKMKDIHKRLTEFHKGSIELMKGTQNLIIIGVTHSSFSQSYFLTHFGKTFHLNYCSATKLALDKNHELKLVFLNKRLFESKSDTDVPEEDHFCYIHKD